VLLGNDVWVLGIANAKNHSIRGFVSGHVIKKLGPKVESTKSEAGERTYRIVG
jgi:Protein of unknown function (DUF3489)